ncbi:MAG: type II toxin-antitoxin system RelB/DinJ family antitoxin [Clostridiales bacterium]|jgi:DNA-damage-inducible protein J|nr:type II toxin-antitoxin system RelB/DinJ family antitoxin [Clostridiales bacterium]
MEPTNINIRMDKNLKRQAESLFSELGMNMTTAFNIFLRQSVREGRIPFEISLNRPNYETLEAMKEAEEMKQNPSLGKSYTDVDQMMKELLD